MLVWRSMLMKISKMTSWECWMEGWECWEWLLVLLVRRSVLYFYFIYYFIHVSSSLI